MSKPKNIVLVRHGQSQANVDKTIYKTVPDYALKLTPFGKGQALAAGQKIKTFLEADGFVNNEEVQFYISPFWRTRQTYQLIAKSFVHKKMYEDSRLREQEWNGKLPVDGYRDADEMERDSFGHFYYRFDGGESCADVEHRVGGFMNTMFRDFQKDYFAKNVIIVNHGMTMRVFLKRWLHLTVEEFEILANPENCGFHILQLQPDGKYKLITELKKYPSLKHKYQYDWNELA